MHMPHFRMTTQWIAVASMLTLMLPAQSATTALSGRVVDQKGAVIPRVVISVVDEARSMRHETTTGAEGLFVIDQLPPSTYTVRVEKEGFAAVEFENVILNVTEQRSFGDIKLGAITLGVRNGDFSFDLA